MPSEATRSTPPSSTFTPPGQRGRYSQPNLPTLLVSYNDGRCSTSGSPDRRIRMSQPTLNSSLSGLTFPMNMTKGRLSFPSLRASGDNYTGFKIDEEHLSAPNVHHNSVTSNHDTTHVLKRDPINKRDRLSQPTLVTGDYFPGRGHQRLSQPCLTSGRDLISINSPLKMKRISSPQKLCQRERIHQLDFGGRNRRELQPPDLTKFNRDRFSIPELETANDLRLIAGTPKQRFSLDSSLGEPKRRSRLLPIASSPISENHLSNANNNNEGKKPSDGLETVLIASASPLLPQVENALESFTIQPSFSQRMSVPDISTSSLRRLLDPPAKQRHSITGNLRQCLLPVTKKIPKKDSQDYNPPPLPLPSLPYSHESKTEIKNIQRHYSYTYETKSDSKFIIKETMSAIPRKKFLESNFDRNEQVITTVIESEVPIILTNQKTSEKLTMKNFCTGTPKWIRKYIGDGNQQDNDTKKSGHPGNLASKRKAWQNSKRESVDSVDEEKNLNGGQKLIEKKSPADKNDDVEVFFNIEEGNFHFNRTNEVNRNSGWEKTYGAEAEESESEESTSI